MSAAYDLSDEIKDISNSLAYNVLEDLHKDGLVSKAQVDLYKSKYAKLHEFVLQTYENEKNFLRRAKELNHRLMSEKIRLEKTTIEQAEDATNISQLKGQLAKMEAEYETVGEREAMLQMQLSELEHEKRELEERLVEREADEQQKAEPIIQKAKDEIASLEKEIEQTRLQKDSHAAQHKDLLAKHKGVEEDVDTNKLIHEQHEREYKKIQNDPERIRKQAEKFESAVKSLTQSQKEKHEEIEQKNESLTTLESTKKEREDQRGKAQLRLTMIRDSVKITNQSAEEVKKKLEREKNEEAKARQKRLALDQELKMLNDESRSAADELSQKQKKHEKTLREYKKMEQSRDNLRESLTPLEAQRKDLIKQRKQRDEEMRRQRKLLDDIQAEVDLFIGAFLKQETLEKEKKEEHESIVQSMEEMQKDLRNLKQQEQQWSNHFKFLSSQREKIARDSSTAHRLCRETWDEVQMKELEEFDLKKKLQEISQRQKEFCTMYEVVKNERNKYVAMIQSSSQNLSEMKEKLKILQNEVEILRMESAGKDKALQKTRTEAQRQRVIRDQLRTEWTRITAKGKALNDQVEQYVIEIDKLNSIINSIEKEMVILKRKYEQAVETRNFTGIQLIDRNDELCILWEKSNIQEKLLKKGEDVMLSKEEDIRILKIHLAEVQRQLQVVQKKIPEVPRLAEEVLRLRESLSEVRQRAEKLSLELENPSSVMRKWRQLGGEDLDAETLHAKIQLNEERLNDKKEALLEKELILEEVTALSDKLRQQAIDGRQGTLELSQKVNLFQAKIKDMTRKMMATVSELSMYQATAMKFQTERDEVQEKVMQARENIEAGLAPTETADAEFERTLALEQQRKLDSQNSKQRKQEDEILHSTATRTTAEPRVNAYIPDGEYGLPKAYGSHAPFMPTTLGSTMRHIKKPNPKPIEI